MKILLDHIYIKSCGQLEEIPDSSIDVIITSPPYNLSCKKQKNKKHNMYGYDTFSDNLPQEEYEIGQINLLNSCCRVIKPGGSIFYNHKERQKKGVAITPYKWVLQSVCELVQTIIWNRGSTHNIDPVRLYPTDEYIFHLRKPGYPPKFNSKCAKWTKVWNISFSETRKIAHPAPFPVLIPLRCLQMCDLNKESIVLDPCLGSGSTALAAIELGVRWIGYEISEQYVALAKQRINLAQNDIFN